MYNVSFKKTSLMLLSFLKERGKGNDRSLLITLLRVGRQGCGLAFLGIDSAAFC